MPLSKAKMTMSPALRMMKSKTVMKNLRRVMKSKGKLF